MNKLKKPKPKKNLKTLKGRLRYLREQSGYSLQDVALKMGKSASYRNLIFKWEQEGEYEPSLKSIQALSEVYGVSIEWIINGESK